MLGESKCSPQALAPKPQLREVSYMLSDLIDKANSIAAAIDDKLFGCVPVNECDKPCTPNALQGTLDGSIKGIQQLLGILDEINCRL